MGSIQVVPRRERHVNAKERWLVGAEERFAESARDLWLDKGWALMDPEQSFYEGEGRDNYPDGKRLEKLFERLGVPYRDYSMGGPEWLRKMGSR